MLFCHAKNILHAAIQIILHPVHWSGKQYPALFQRQSPVYHLQVFQAKA